MQDFKTLYWPRPISRPGHVSITLRVSLNGRRLCNLAIGLHLPAASWQQKGQRVKKHPLANEHNTRLGAILALMEKRHLELIATGQVLTTDDVRAIVHPGKASKVPTLGQCLNDYAAANQNSGKRPNTVRSIASRLTIVTTVAQGLNLAGKKVDQITARDGVAFLASLQKLGGQLVTNRRILGVAKDVLRVATDAGHCQGHPWATLAIDEREKAKAVLALNQVQLHRLRTLDLAPDLDHIRQLFLAQVATGMAYADLPQLATTAVHLVQGIRVLIYSRQKTGTTAYVPVTEDVQGLLNQWPAGPQLPTNQHYNRALKQIGEALGLRWALTTHHGRKTCATLLRQSGMPSDTIALILGHTDTRITNRHYISRGPELLVAALASKV